MFRISINAPKFFIMAKKKNKKVRNATKRTVDGIDFKSKLEVHCYEKLKENNISAEYENNKFEILPSFEYNGKKIRKMTYTPDFVGKDFIIECKGNPNDAFPLRWKIFKYYLYKNNIQYDLYLPRSKKQVDETVEKIKQNESDNGSSNAKPRRGRKKSTKSDRKPNA